MSGVLIAISGRKQAGKGTIFKFIERLNKYDGRPTKEFSFAEPLKRMCVDILGIREEQAYGTEEQKNSLVEHILWENFPRQECRRIINEHGIVTRLRSGPMTGREIMQYWGSEIYRYQYNDVWADAGIRSSLAWIANNTDGVAVFSDNRFENEVLATLLAGGFVIRLTRDPYGDNHTSETALDPDKFNWERFTTIIDNSKMNVFETCMVAYPALSSLGVIPSNLTPHQILFTANELHKETNQCRHSNYCSKTPIKSSRVCQSGVE